MKLSMRHGIALAIPGAGLGMMMMAIIKKAAGRPESESRVARQELPFIVAMIVLDIAAPICLLFGLSMTSAANVSLLNNFEIVGTAIIALLIFKEAISPRLWLGIIFVTVSCVLLSFEDISGLQFNSGSLFVLLACICWGIENNCTRKLSSKDPLQIVMIKGIFSGTGSLIIGFICGERIPHAWTVPSGPAARLCRLRTQHLFLCLCPEDPRSSKDKRLLCRFSLYRCLLVASDLP